MQKPSIAKGTRDFSPLEMSKRNYIFNTIRDVFHLFGFQQIETPAMENLSTLMGKYGEEGDKLLFKILNSGDYCTGVDPQLWQGSHLPKLTSAISEKGLRYDLTVPFARYVVMHQNEIVFPFRRYQIQPVWRADRPQRGRYREFFQCDADVVGSDSLLNEVELIQIMNEVYQRLGIKVCIKMNNRKILSGIAQIIGQPDKIVDITVAIDKYDKIGIEKVTEELISKGISEESIAQLRPILSLSGNNKQKLELLGSLLASSEEGLKGVEELQTIIGITEGLALSADLEIDLTLARGLNYYTGAIFEVKALDVAMGSITGGGRYDNLTGVFGLKGVSGVGISFGADRIFDVLNTLDLYPKEALESTEFLFVNFGSQELSYILPIAASLRASGARVEIYPDMVKMKKQMAYADQKAIPMVVIAGQEEILSGTVVVKNMTTGEQAVYTKSDFLVKFG